MSHDPGWRYWMDDDGGGFFDDSGGGGDDGYDDQDQDGQDQDGQDQDGQDQDDQDDQDGDGGGDGNGGDNGDDPEYREVCRDSPRKWRARHPDYWKQYRQKNPAAVERNRQRQQARDRKRKLCNLANNTSALDLKHSAAQIWLVGSGAADLANNNLAPAQIWVIEALSPHRRPVPPSCKQHPAGVAVDPAA